MVDNMGEYKKLLKQLADDNSDKFINNSSIDHAAAIIEELFRRTNGVVRILSDHLNPDVYAQAGVKEASVEFLKKDKSKLQIIMQFKEKGREGMSNNGFLSHLKGFKDKITLFEASEELKKIKNHFMVSITDKNSYALRYETDIESHIATATFNVGDPGQKLCEYFDSNVISCEQISDEKWAN